MTTEARMTYEIKKTYRELVREDIRAQVTEAVYACIGGSPWTDDVEDGLKDLFARFDAALDGVGVIAEILDKRFEYRYPPFPPDIFDDRDAMVRNTIDLDIGDCGRLLLDDGVDLDDRAAVERRMGHLWIYHRSNPAFQARFIDEAIGAAKATKAARELEDDIAF